MENRASLALPVVFVHWQDVELAKKSSSLKFTLGLYVSPKIFEPGTVRTFDGSRTSLLFDVESDFGGR
jgi:hypothetical protein